MRIPFVEIGAVAAAALIGIVVSGTASAKQLSFTQVERGRYLAAAGDCEGCHTGSKDKPYAGGRGLETPFGTVYVTNITPDRDTGIGSWTADDFYRALHDGLRSNGERLYPAFPFPWFTKVTREDSDAIFAYLQTLSPVKNSVPANQLPWPLSNRLALAGWDELYFSPHTFAPVQGKSAEWNRGAYLVEGLGHCGACHTPINFLGAPEKSRYLQGGTLENWYAANLTGDLRRGLGAWSADEIVEYLKTGRTAKSAAFGTMSEVIEFSTSHLSDGDLRAIAAYLKDQPAAKAEASSSKPDAAAMKRGEALYVDNCTGCHLMKGEGIAGLFPELKGNPIVQADDPTSAIRIILNGAHAVATSEQPTPVAMPAFDWKLSDAETADLTNYIRNAWGNAGGTVSSSDVEKLRKNTRSASEE